LTSLAPELVFYITPILALLGGLFLYMLSLSIYNKKTALLTGLLLFILPPYWFWANMDLFNNMGASVFLIGTVVFTLYALKTKKLAYYILTGVALGINNFFRFTDIIYCLPLLSVVFVFRKEVIYKYLLATTIAYLIVISPLFITNKQLFGNFLSFGYTASDDSGIKEHVPFIMAVVNKLTFFLLPSGFHPMRIFANVYTYIIAFVPLFFIFMILGVTNIYNNRTTLAKAYIIYFVILSIVILVYYGGGVYWGLDYFTLDSSYIRYFLPIYIFSIPIIANLVLTFPKKISILLLSVVIITSIINVHTVKSGIIEMNLRRISSNTQKDNLLKLIPTNAVVITTYSDKVIFPERKVLFYGPIYNQVLQSDKIFTYEKLNKIILNLENKNNEVIVLNDRGDLELNKINKLLNNSKLKLEKIDELQGIYKVSK
ncbi:MAG: glycosyltransferase family 39 protein, partial [Candidatus Levyibacteriota bacterium]